MDVWKIKGMYIMIMVKVMVKLSLYLIKHHAMKMYTGMVSPFMASALSRGVWSAKRPQYPLDRRLGHPQSVWTLD
jgi:hypothetical protein